MTKQVKVVLVLFAAGSEFARQMFWGVQKFACTAGWYLQSAEFLLTDDGVCRLARSPTGTDIARLLDFWKPDGCIVTPGRLSYALPSVYFKKYPTVFIDRYPTGGSVQPRTYKATGLVRRESSCIVKGRDRRVAKALEFIRVHACEGIGPRQVVGEMGISRTLADTSFRAAAGHTILDEIHYVRLERAKELLLRDMPPSIVADRCGYSSIIDLRRVFKARVGMTIGKYLASASSV